MKIFEYYRHKIFREMGLSPWFIYINLAFSHCPQQQCDSDDNDHYNTLIIFSYPNGTVTNLDIINLLYYYNEDTIYNLTLRIWDYISIHNNIFGDVLKDLVIMDISNKSMNLTSTVTGQ